MLREDIDVELLEKIYKTFEPLNEEEQKLVFFMAIDSYLQCCTTLEKDKLSVDATRVITVEKGVFQLFVNIFAKVNPEIKKVGFDPKKVMFEDTKKRRTELLEKVDGNS